MSPYLSPTEQTMSAYQAKRKKLLIFLDRSFQICADLDMKTSGEKLRVTKESVESERFRLLVTGRFNSGKSTFINALMGEKILPTSPIPCTAIINEVKYSEKKTAVLYFKNPFPKDFGFTLPEPVQRHVDEYNNDASPVEPLNTEVENLYDYVTIPYGSDYSVLGSTPFERADIYWPLDLCRNGVEIVDSPGLDDVSVRDDIVMNYLRTTDAIINVISVKDVGAASGLSYIQKMSKETKMQDIFFVITHFDEIDADDRKVVCLHAISKLQSLTTLKKEGIFFISSTSALKGKKQQDNKFVEESGITGLEKAVFSYLTNDRGKVKLLRPVREIKSALLEAQNNIQMKKGSSHASLEEIEQRIKDVRPRLEDLTQKKDSLLRRIERKRTELRNEVEKNFLRWLMDVESKDQLPAWIDAITIETDVTKCKNLEESCQKISLELTKKIRGKMDAEFEIWRENKFSVIVKDFEDDITNQIRSVQSEIALQIQQVQSDISATSIENELSLETVESELDFIGVTGAYIVATVGVVAGLCLLPVFTIPALMFGIGPFVQFIANFKKGIIKSSIKMKMLKDWDEKSKEMAQDLAEKVYNDTDGYVRYVNTEIGGRIQGLEEQLQNILEEKRRAVKNTETTLKNLHDTELACLSLMEDISEFDRAIGSCP